MCFNLTTIFAQKFYFFLTSDLRICRHVRFNRIRAEQQTETIGNCGHQIQQKLTAPPTEPKRFSIEWHGNFFKIFLNLNFQDFDEEMMIYEIFDFFLKFIFCIFYTNFLNKIVN